MAVQADTTKAPAPAAASAAEEPAPTEKETLEETCRHNHSSSYSKNE